MIIVQFLGFLGPSPPKDDNIPKSTKLARLLLISVDGNRSERVRAKSLSDVALSVVKGGSSQKGLDRLVKQLFEL
jgi:hypothetical protein